ncbi:hypothetical protein [Moorena sp. SIO4G3]|uniref:hypothetical protein n=1 Tax=Moorena sp. SIO4G3 TaxID=2607821 RepID=UPI00142BAC38|nr:hypothetical protein [Moorena sp. SIO4G3]NEO74942.1 hypothetical protein [Moorena sp. SIO4G3]
MAETVESSNLDNTKKLGFCDAPIPKIIYVKNSENGKYLWHFWNHSENKPEAIYHQAIRCFVSGLEIVAKEFLEKEVLKLRIQVLADKPYSIQSGIDSIFSRCFLLSLVKLSPEQVKEPLTIALRGNDTSKGNPATVFCSLYDSRDRYISYDWDASVNIYSIANACQSLLSGQPISPPGPESEPQTKPQTRAQQSEDWIKSHESFEILKQTSKELQRLRWSKQDGVKYLQQVYGKISRQFLTPEELLDFLKRLQSFPTPDNENMEETVF